MLIYFEAVINHQRNDTFFLLITKDVHVYFELFVLGYCLYLKGKGPYVHSYSCDHFVQGCHNTSYRSINIYERKCCNSLMLHPLLKVQMYQTEGHSPK